MKFTAFIGTLLFTSQSWAALPGFTLDGESWSYTGEGAPLKGILLKPEGPGPFPAIIISHGSGGNAERFALPKAREMVKWGFVCIATNYTFAGGPGATPPKRAPGVIPGASMDERSENLRRVTRQIEILESIGYVDNKRIAAYGNSAGAVLTINLAGAMPGKIAAAAMTAGGIGGRFGSEENAGKIRCPFLILHGGADPVVPPEASLALKNVLDRNHVPNRRQVWDGIAHNLHGDKRDEVFAAIREWFQQNGVLR